MNTFKHQLHARCDYVVKSGLCFIVLTLMMVLSPAINPLQNVQAAIDETMPATIPAEIIADWKDKDGTSYETIIAKIKTDYPKIADKITGTGEQGYLSACHWRRVERMKPYEADIDSIMFMRHHNFGGILVGYHDNSDGSNSDQEWASKGAMCVLNLKNYYSTFTELLTKTDAVVRDPCISFDGKKVLFAISGKGKGTGYKIYEMDIADTKTLKQITTDPEGLSNVADFEPCYLPNGDIMFTSTRNFGLTDCAFNPTTNMFVMSGAGKYIRQVGFDQVHTFYPVMCMDGTVMYTRWEYNDRDITNTMGVFVMNPDGSRQTEWFGNQTSWPFTMIHARPIPNTTKAIAVAGGHHGPYAGELMIIDNQLGYNGKQSISMIAPKRETKPAVNKSDVSMGGVNFIFQTPYPLDDKCFLVSWRKTESVKTYKLYFMDVDGNRELLAWADQSVSQPVLIKAWEKMPFRTADKANYNDSLGAFTMQDVYTKSDAMKGIEKGAAKTLRVVKLSYRAAGTGSSGGMTMGTAPSGLFSPAIFVPVSQWGGSWEAKEVLGEAKIYEDGSAAFTVPARTPVYFQVLDSLGQCIATMRSWSTLMPGEKFACTGCHESKLEAPPKGNNPLAGTPKPLDKTLGVEGEPFDYKKMVQPIFDKNCVSCHKSGHTSGFDLTGDLVSNSGTKKSWTKSYSSLLSGIGSKASNKAINTFYIFTQSEQLAPYAYGSSKSGIMKTGGGNGNHHDIKLTEKERRIIACWIDLACPHAGTYSSYMSTTDASSYEKQLQRREKWEAIEAKGLKELASLQTAVNPGDNGGLKAIRSVVEQIGIGYIPSMRTIVLKKCSFGNFIMVDLRGRVITRMELSNLSTDADVTIALPASLGTGLYLAKFEGANGIIQQAKISISR